MRGFVLSIAAVVLGAVVTASSVHASLNLNDSFDSGVTPDSVGYSGLTNTVFVHGELTSTILRFTPTGTPLSSVPYVYTTDVFDLDVATAPMTIGGIGVPAGTLFTVDGDTGPDTIAALDPLTGAVLSFINVSASAQTVGGAYHPIRDSFFLVDWQADMVYEVSPSNGALLNSFSVAPGGSPAFDINYGDLDVLESSGELLLVSSSQDVVRVMSPTGTWLNDLDVSGLGISGMSGIAYDDSNSRAFVSSVTDGRIYNVGGNFSTVPEPAAIGLIGVAATALLRRRRLA